MVVTAFVVAGTIALEGPMVGFHKRLDTNETVLSLSVFPYYTSAYRSNPIFFLVMRLMHSFSLTYFF